MNATQATAHSATGVQFQRVVGALVAAGGALTMAERAFGLPEWIHLVPCGAGIKAIAALAFLFTGCALILLTIPGARARNAAQICVLAAGGIGLFMLVGYAAGQTFQIAELPLGKPTSPAAAAQSGRMMLAMGLCIVVTAVGLWLIKRPPGNAARPLILTWLGSFVAAAGLFTVLVHLVGSEISYGWWNLANASIPAALLFILLGAGLLVSAWREAQVSWVIGRMLTTAFAAALALLVAVSIYSNRSAMRLIRAAERVQHTHQVTAKIAELRSDLNEIQSGKRGYIITGNPDFLPQAVNKEPLVRVHLAALRELMREDPSQQERLSAFMILLAEWEEFSRWTIEVRRAKGFEAAAQLIDSGRGKGLLNQIRALLHEMSEEENRLLVLRKSMADEITGRTISILPIGTALSLLLLIAGFIQLNGSTAARMRSSEALKESEDRFRTMADAMPQLAWMAEPDGHIFWYNRQWYEFTGASPEAMVGWGRKSVHDPELLPRVMESWATSIADAKPFEMEFPLRRADGQFRWFLTRAVPLKDAAGKLVRWFGTNTDVTQKREAEEEIFKLNARLEQRVRQRTAELQAANASLADFKAALDEHAIVSIMDCAGKITYVNGKFCSISGYSREELIGQDTRVVHSSEQPENLVRELWQTISAGRVWKGELRRRAKNNGVDWEDSTIVPFFDASGKVSQFIAICSDITRRKLVEEALREGEERARLATAVAGVAVWAWDVQTGSIKWDELMFTLYGMQPTPDGCVSYTTWKATVFQDDLAEQVAVLERTAATGGSSQREFRIIRASDNAVRIMQAAEVMVEGVAGAANRLVGINIDITERRRGEEVIAKLNADLQRRSERLEEANKELEAFSYSVSHDLRAPLRAVDGFSKMVLDRYRGVLGEEGGRMLSIVRGETQRMGQLIDDLLAFCRIGRKAVESMEVDMHAMARAVFDELVQLEPERKLTLNLHPLPTVRGMPAMLRQVWVNLIGNAIKFTKERDVGLIEIDSRKGEDGELIYSVKDNGVGFDMRYAEKLFGVFQRLHAAHEFPGTGVGLAIAKRILQRHGGRIWVEAEIDKGAIFSFALPI